MLGDRVRSEKAFDAALGALPEDPAFQGGRTDYGSPLRDAAVLVTLAAEGDAPKPILVSGTKRIETARNKVSLHLDAGRRVARARGPRARQARREPGDQ